MQLKISCIEKLRRIHTLFSRSFSSAYNYRFVTTEKRKNRQTFSFLKDDDKLICFTLRLVGLVVVLLQSILTGATSRVSRLHVGSSNRRII